MLLIFPCITQLSTDVEIKCFKCLIFSEWPLLVAGDQLSCNYLLFYNIHCTLQPLPKSFLPGSHDCCISSPGVGHLLREAIGRYIQTSLRQKRLRRWDWSLSNYLVLELLLYYCYLLYSSTGLSIVLLLLTVTVLDLVLYYNTKASTNSTGLSIVFQFLAVIVLG